MRSSRSHLANVATIRLIALRECACGVAWSNARAKNLRRTRRSCVHDLSRVRQRRGRFERKAKTTPRRRTLPPSRTARARTAARSSLRLRHGRGYVSARRCRGRDDARVPRADEDVQCSVGGCAGLSCDTTTLGRVCCGNSGASCTTAKGEGSRAASRRADLAPARRAGTAGTARGSLSKREDQRVVRDR